MDQSLIGWAMHRVRWLRMGAIAIFTLCLIQPITAYAVAPITFEIPAVQGPGTKGFGVVSDPTIQPFLAPGVAAPVGLTLPIDLQGNGRPDLLACHADFPVNPIVKVPCRVLRPQSDGTVIDVTRQLFGTGTLPSMEHPREIVVGDFNHDGRPDIFIAAHGYDAAPFNGETNVLLISNPDGTYTDRSSTLPQSPDFSHSACAGDINGDGNLDIYVGNIFGARNIGPYFLLGKVDGTFAQNSSGLPPRIVSLQETYISCVLVDVDGNGFPDLVFGTYNPNGNLDSIVLFNDGTGDFTKRERYVLPAHPLSKQAKIFVLDIVPLDVDRDGKPDLLMLGQTGYTGFGVQVLINRGDGTFADETTARMGTSQLRTTGSWCAFLQLADFNGDGWEDFYCDTNGWNENFSRIWLNNGDGTWTPVASDAMPKQSSLEIMHAVDFDGNGLPDLIRIGWGGTGADIGYKSFLNRTARTVASEPQIRSAIAGNGQATVSFDAPLGTGTSPITGYTATCSPSTFTGSVTSTGSASPIVVTGLTNGKFYDCAVAATSATGKSLASAKLAVKPTPYTGLWWNASESGWGMSLTQHGTTIFMAWYAYDATGKPTWYVMSSCPVVGAACTGDIYNVTGGTSLSVPWNSAAKVVTKVGTGTLSFAGSDTGTFTYTLNGVNATKSIARQPFATGTTPPSIDYSDLWWNANESGWGVALTQQYGTIFVTMYSYDAAGKPLWYVASNCPVVGNGCTGDLYQVNGGTAPTVPWDGANKVVAKVGTVDIVFTDSANAAMTYTINGASGSKIISRQPF